MTTLRKDWFTGFPLGKSHPGQPKFWAGVWRQKTEFPQHVQGREWAPTPKAVLALRTHSEGFDGSSWWPCSFWSPNLESGVGILNVNVFTVLRNFYRPTTVSTSTRSLQRCGTSRFVRYTCTSIDPMSVSIQHLSPALGSSPSTTSICRNWPLSLLWDNNAAFLISSASVTHLVIRLSCPPCQIIPWSGITIPEQLQFEFPLLQLQLFPKINEKQIQNWW